MRKHYYLFLFFFLTVVGCLSIDMDEPIASQESETLFDSKFEAGFTFDVNLKAATYLAETQSADKKLKTIDPIVYEGDTVMYLANFQNNKGWMIISADKRVEPVLSVHDKGNYREEDVNGGVVSWFTTIAEDISYLKKNITDNTNPDAYSVWASIDRAANTTPELQAYYERKYGIIPPEHYEIVERDGRMVAQFKAAYAANYSNQYVYLVRRYVGARTEETNRVTTSLLPVKWGQGVPWNAGQFPYVRDNSGTPMTPPAGCVAVAMGQVLYSLHHHIGKPNGLYHNVSYYGDIYDEDNYDVFFHHSDYHPNSDRWENMALNWEDTLGEISFVGDLFEELGYQLGMQYAYNGSGAIATPSHFNAWGIVCEEADYNANTVLGQLQNGRVVYMSGYAVKDRKGIWPFTYDSYEKGHAWVIDGYVNVTTNRIETYRWELATRCPQNGNSGGSYDPYHPCNDPYSGSWGYGRLDV